MRFTRLFATVFVLLQFAPYMLAETVETFTHGDAVYAVEYHPTDSSQFVSGSDDNTVKLWNLRDRILTTFSGHTDIVNSVTFSPDGETLASGSDDRTFKVWDISGEQIIATLEHIPIVDRPASIVTSVTFSPDGTHSRPRDIKLSNSGMLVTGPKRQHFNMMTGCPQSFSRQTGNISLLWMEGK